MPANVASIIGELLDKLDDAAGLRDDGGSVEPFLDEVDKFLEELRNGVNAARRLVHVWEDRLKLMGDPEGWETLGAPYNDPDHLSRAYLPAGQISHLVRSAFGAKPASHVTQLSDRSPSPATPWAGHAVQTHSCASAVA